MSKQKQETIKEQNVETVKTEVKNKITKVSTDTLLSKESTNNEKVLGIFRKSMDCMEQVYKTSKQTSYNRGAKVTKALIDENEEGEQTPVTTPILELAKIAWSVIVKVENKMKDYESYDKLKLEETDKVKLFYEAVVKKYSVNIKKNEYPIDLF